MNPVSLELLRRRLPLVHVREGQAITEPLHAETCYKCALSYPLGSVEDEHSIELCAWVIDPCYGGTKDFSGDGANIGVVRCTKVIYE